MSFLDNLKISSKILAALLVVRLASLGLYPVMDKTEARYAEIGRAMLSLGDWITPWYDTNIPFWGKPPLSFWATAASLGTLGVNEFAARLPHFLAALAVGGLVWNWVKRYDRQDALTTIALLAGSSLVWVAAGAVMTDMILLLGLTLTMRGFWFALNGDAEQQAAQAAAVAVERHTREVFLGVLSGERGLGHVRAGALRTEFDEHAHARGVHRFDFGDEFDAVQQVTVEGRLDARDIGRISLAGGVRVDADARHADRAGGNCGRQAGLGAGDQFGVESAGHGEAGHSHALRFERLRGLFDTGRRAGNHRLFRRVVVGDLDAIEPGNRSCDDFALGLDRGHRALFAGRSGFGHALAAHGGQLQESHR